MACTDPRHGPSERLLAFTMALALCLSMVSFATPSGALAADVVVHAGEDLQAAIAAASPGDVIVVDPGTYVTSGQVVIDKDLTIIGSGTAETIVQNGMNTLGTAMTTFATTGWFYVTSAGALNISDMTFDGGALGGIKTGAAIYAMGPLTADNLHVTQVKYLPTTSVGVGIALMGAGHTVTDSVFDEIGRIGIYVGAGPAIDVGDMDPSIEYGTVVDGCTFTGNGAGDYCQYGMEVGRSGRAHVTNSTFSQYSGLTSSGGWNSACLYVNSYWGVGTSKLVVDTCTFSDAEWGVVAGYPGDPSGVPTDAILSISRSTFNAVPHDVTADGDIQSTPIGVDNAAPDHDWLYERHDDTGALVASPAPLAEGFINWFPEGVADAYSVQKNVTLTVSAAGVLANDTDGNASDSLTAELVGDGAQHGILMLNEDGSFSYEPEDGFTGTDGFTYRAADWLDTSEVTSVALTVSNTAPVAANRTYSTSEDTALVKNAVSGVLVGSSDANGDTITALRVTNPGHGALDLAADGSFTYTPNANWYGADTFTYKVNDGSLDSAVKTVTITVSAVNDAPVAVPDSYGVVFNTALVVPARGVLANDTDLEGDALTAQLVKGPSRGTLTLSANGSFTYTPNADVQTTTDTFTYRAKDATAYSAPTTVTFTIGADATPPPPVANLMPIYRFYSTRSGTHFYTPSAEECDYVMATWPDVWGYEGIAYYVNPAKNKQPLHRFYNQRTGSHFYTSSSDEASTVIAKYGNVFVYDGQSFAVTPYAEAGKAPVYRFYNLKNGSHFYTASLEEANHVIVTWPDIYQLEGPAFWLGQ